MSSTPLFAAFRSPVDLLSALCCCVPQERSFPAEIGRDDELGWAVPVTTLAPLEALEHLARQHDWKLRLVHGPLRTVSIFTLLKGVWTYEDPIDAGLDIRPGTASWNPASGGIQYLLGARDEAQAQAILEALTSALVERIHAVPVRLTGVRDEPPFRYFWSALLRRPNRLVLESAARAWWEPPGFFGAQRIFLEWRYSIPLPTTCLHRLPWGRDARLILLSREDPEVLLLRSRDGDPVFNELESPTSFRVGDARVAELHSAGSRSPLDFKVRVHLVAENPQQAAVNRMEELDQEIAAKREIRNQIARRTKLPLPLVVVREPLFLIPETEETRGEVPHDIRRLLIEWADQREDLRSLYYLKIDSGALQRGLFPTGSDVHVLTTAAALGVAGSNVSAGLRLWDYQPLDGISRAFDLMPQWAEVGLRLFVPHRLHVSLYPGLMPSEVAAEKLGAALIGSGRLRSEWLVAIFEDPAGRMQVLRLPIREFVSLFDAYQWTCRLEVAVDDVRSAESIRQRLVSTILDSVGHSFLNAVQRELTLRMDRDAGQYAMDLAALDAERQRRHAKISEFQKLISGTRETAAQIAGALTELEKAAAGLNQELQAVTREAGVDAQLVEELRRLVESCGKLKSDIEGQRRKLGETLKRVRRQVR